MIKLVIFDVDGTLVDTVDMHAEAWQRALKEFGKEVEFSAVREQIGKGGHKMAPLYSRVRPRMRHAIARCCERFEGLCTKSTWRKISRAKAQSAAAFLRGFLCAFAALEYFSCKAGLRKQEHD